MKKSQVVNNLLKPNKVILGRENKSFIWFGANSNGIYIPIRKKYK